MRVPNKLCYLENRVVREPGKQRSACTMRTIKGAVFPCMMPRHAIGMVRYWFHLESAAEVGIFHLVLWITFSYKVLYMCFDKFLLAVESRDLSQADKSIIRVSPFPNQLLGSRTSFSVS